MEKIVHRCNGSGIIWDSRRGKVFYDFTLNHGIFETSNPDDISYMQKNGYVFNKVVIDVEEQENVKIEKKVVLDNPVVVIDEDKKEKIDNVILPIPEALSRESLFKLLDDKEIKYKKNMKLENLQKLLDEAK